jgi:hypothetical protein
MIGYVGTQLKFLVSQIENFSKKKLDLDRDQKGPLSFWTSWF